MRSTTSQAIRQLLSLGPFTRNSETRHINGTSQRAQQCLRAFSNSATTAADIPTSPPGSSSSQSFLATDLFNITRSRRTQASALAQYNPLDASRIDYSGEIDPDGLSNTSLMQKDIRKEPHHFHIYATKHNTHITVTTPERAPLISVACGNIGFRKARRRQYDAAFQLAGYVMKQMAEKGINTQINKLEVVLRGFGAGREAVTKALLGSEGRFLKDKVCKVSDSTRVKFGGTRGRKPKRLG